MDRAKLYLSKIPNQEVGAYSTVSQGYKFVQQEIKEFIERRDGYEANADQIYLTNGASEGIQQWLRLIINNPNDGIMIQTPTYALYVGMI